MKNIKRVPLCCVSLFLLIALTTFSAGAADSGSNWWDVEGGLEFYSPPVSWSTPLLWGATRVILDEPLDVETKIVYKAVRNDGTISAETGSSALAWRPSNRDSAVQIVEDSYKSNVVKLSDEDWYKIAVPDNTLIFADLSFVHSHGDINLELFRGAEDTVKGLSLFHVQP